MAHLKVGVQLEPQHCSIAELRGAWRRADALGVDSIWTWDHFFPLRGDPDGHHFEGWTLLATMACDTSYASIGVLVSCNSYRSPDLLADMARTVDHVSGGRVILGVGAGWCERDYREYGIEFGPPAARLVALEAGIERIRARLAKLNPAPLGPLPLLIGGEGERVTLRLAAAYADIWNCLGPVEKFAAKNKVLDGWCERLGRDPTSIERSVLLYGEHDLDHVEAFLAAGATHLIVPVRAPFNLSAVRPLLSLAGKGS
jgi:probable F420-dependent oxidoreductase